MPEARLATADSHATPRCASFHYAAILFSQPIFTADAAADATPPIADFLRAASQPFHATIRFRHLADIIFFCID